MEKPPITEQLDLPFPDEPEQLSFDFEGKVTESARPETEELLKQAAGAPDDDYLPPGASWDLPPGASGPKDTQKVYAKNYWGAKLGKTHDEEEPVPVHVESKEEGPTLETPVNVPVHDEEHPQPTAPAPKQERAPSPEELRGFHERYAEHLAWLKRQRAETEIYTKEKRVYEFVKKWGERYQRLPPKVKVGIGIGLAGGAMLSSGALGTLFAVGVVGRRMLAGAATAVMIEAALHRIRERKGGSRTEQQERFDRRVALMSGALASFGFSFAGYIGEHIGHTPALETVAHAPTPAASHEQIKDLKGVINQLYGDKPHEDLLHTHEKPITFHAIEHAETPTVTDVDAEAAKAGWHEVPSHPAEHAVPTPHHEVAPVEHTAPNHAPAPHEVTPEHITPDELQIRNMYGMTTEEAIADPRINHDIQQMIGRKLTDIYRVFDGHRWVPGGMDPRWQALRDLPGGAKELLYRPESIHAPGFNFIGTDDTTQQLHRYIRDLYASTNVKVEPNETAGHYIRRMLAFNVLRTRHLHQTPTFW